MHVFITGVSGLIGSAISRQLIAQGHGVSGLARNDQVALTLSRLGITPVRGDLSDTELLRQTAQTVDAVIHCAFDNDAMLKGQAIEACAKDREAIKALCEPLVGTGKVFLNSSGLLGNLGADEWAKKLVLDQMPRALSDELTLSYCDKGVKAINIRLAPITYGHRRPHPFFAGQVDAAKRSGSAKYVDQGEQVWATCDAEDAASLYILALTSDVPPGASLNASSAEHTTRSLAEFIGRTLQLPIESIEAKDAMNELGFVGLVMQMGTHTEALLTTKWTGWKPKGVPFFDHALETYLQ